MFTSQRYKFKAVETTHALTSLIKVIWSIGHDRKLQSTYKRL